jgi:DNA mismatch repair protein MutL
VVPEQPVLIPAAEQHELRRDWSALEVRVEREMVGREREMVPPGRGEEVSGVETVEVPVAREPVAVPFRMLDRLGEGYWLMESEEGLVVLDCRAARERILYEAARARRRDEPVETQVLLAPITLVLSPREFDSLQPHLGTLRRMGVGVSEFGANTLMIDSLPPFYRADGEAAALVSSLMAELRVAGERAPQRRLDDDVVAAAVARHAARVPVPADAGTARELAAELLGCEMPYCCPEGHPTMIQISFQELGRKFGKR